MMYEIKCGAHSDKSTLQLELYKQLFELEFPRAINNPFNETLKGVDLMIDTKAFSEVCQKRTELMARINVYRTLAKVALENEERCRLERNFSLCHEWGEVRREMTEKLETLAEEVDKVVKIMESM